METNKFTLRDPEAAKKDRIKEALKRLRGEGMPSPAASSVGPEVDMGSFPNLEEIPEEEEAGVEAVQPEIPSQPKRKFKLKV